MKQLNSDRKSITASPRHGERGLTLLEIAVSMVVLSVASLFSLSVTVSSVSLDKVNREEANATSVVRRLTEEMRAIPFEQLYASFNANPEDDPGGAGTAAGNSFTVLTDDAGNIVEEDGSSTTHSNGNAYGHTNESNGIARGRSKTKQKFKRIPVSVGLTFPTNGTGQLDETIQHPLFGGQSWDLNGDGQITSDSRNGDYKMLPVVIRLQWEGAGGTRVFEIAQVMTDI